MINICKCEVESACMKLLYVNVCECEVESVCMNLIYENVKWKYVYMYVGVNLKVVVYVCVGEIGICMCAWIWVCELRLNEYKLKKGMCMKWWLHIKRMYNEMYMWDVRMGNNTYAK